MSDERNVLVKIQRRLWLTSGFEITDADRIMKYITEETAESDFYNYTRILNIFFLSGNFQREGCNSLMRIDGETSNPKGSCLLLLIIGEQGHGILPDHT